MSIEATPSVPSPLPDSSRPDPSVGREPVLAATAAFVVLLALVVAIGLAAYQTLNLGSGGGVTSAQSNPAPVAAADGETAPTIAYVDSLDLEVEESSGDFLLTVTAHIGSDPALLPEGEITAVARILGPDEASFELESVVNERGNVTWEKTVSEAGLYTAGVMDIRGEHLTYDSSRDEDALASARAGDDEGPGADERSVDEAEAESEDTIETETVSGEIDSGVAAPGEPDPEATPGIFEDISDGVIGDEEPTPTPTPDDNPFS
ncbi:MAG: hypothetical protein WEB00_03740 [Dehalococcoidia bacterium]